MSRRAKPLIFWESGRWNVLYSGRQLWDYLAWVHVCRQNFLLRP